jgi:hypothetical protein
VAYALEYVAPFRDDAQAMRWQGFTGPPARARRIEVFARAYGLDTADGLVDAVIRRQMLTGVRVRELAARGLEPQRTWLAEGWVAVTTPAAVSISGPAGRPGPVPG